MSELNKLLNRAVEAKRSLEAVKYYRNKFLKENIATEVPYSIPNFIEKYTFEEVRVRVNHEEFKSKVLDYLACQEDELKQIIRNSIMAIEEQLWSED